MTTAEWVPATPRRPESPRETGRHRRLLQLAGVAAHASERTAAPTRAGSPPAGLAPAHALALAESMAWTQAEL